jgi:hypothetical protein
VRAVAIPKLALYQAELRSDTLESAAFLGFSGHHRNGELVQNGNRLALLGPIESQNRTHPDARGFSWN